ncbi:MAG: FG-GAP repeat protein, partial [Myxococcales bacterium]|nr:FG-GAP repeat protein [Myxococcales bacterium]
MGRSVAGSEDIDGDSVPDILAGAPNFSGGAGFVSGKAYAFSGATGAEIFSIQGEAPEDSLGLPVSDVPDLDGDAVPDMLVAARFHDGPGGADAGRVYALSGATGAVLYTLDGASPGAEFGRALSGAGDVDGDGLGDFVVGEVGRATVFSGATGAPIFARTGGPSFGFSAAHAGDVNGDAVPDFIVGEPDEGIARVYSGVGGAFLEDLFFLDRAGSGGAFGFSVAGAGDVNG